MRYLVTGKEMKLLDQNTSEHFHVPTGVLMEQAAMAFVQELFTIGQFNRVLIAVGNGNNGADGISIARLLNQMGVEAGVYYVSDKAGTELFQLQKQIYEEYAYTVIDTIDTTDEYDIIVDAIFGIGLSREVGGVYAEAIKTLNSMKGVKVAVDISSGISADTGEVLGLAFKAEHTITFSFEKVGQIIWPGSEYSGEIHIKQMGITADSFLGRKPAYVTLEHKDLVNLPSRTAHSNKGTYGKLLIIGGDVNMAGAVCFSAKAAYRFGVGLVKVMAHKDNRIIIQSTIPEAVFLPIEDDYRDLLLTNLEWADAVVAGPGMGTGSASLDILSCLLENATCPVILDADALNLLASFPQLLDKNRTDMVITPHLGEMARLTGDSVAYIQEHIRECARDLAQRYELVCVLKDFHTIIASPYGETYINLSGNNGMATAGSGDVLSGIIGTLLAQKMKPLEAAAYGVYVHGLAGDASAEKTGRRGLIASDIIDAIKLIQEM